MAQIVQAFPRFLPPPLAQKDKTPTLAGQWRGQKRTGLQALRFVAGILAFIAAVAHMSPALATDAYRACLPARLHPVSAKILTAFLDGRLTESDFRWGFHLPNSDYLPVGECVLAAVDAESERECGPGGISPDASESCSSY